MLNDTAVRNPEDRLSRILAWFMVGAALAVGWLFITAPLSLWWQAGVGVATIGIGWVMSRRSDDRRVLYALMGVSTLTTTRYLYWRVTETLPIGEGFDAIDLFFATGLILAELYAWGILLLGYFQSVWPLQRRPVPLPDDLDQWPTIDVFIPTYNEPLKVVRPTVFAAMELDWPRDKINVYVLDDGRRPEFAAFCKEIGATHMTRPDNKHAKAGNINHALKQTHGEFVAIFDCDHIPTRSFLQMTAGTMLRDPRMALVQTPHHFFSPDPFERNLGVFRQAPNEGELFYGLLQDGNDYWDATFFCGSCALLRRSALAQIGGIAVETVTEDAHTSLKMHGLGWKSAYINIPQAAGLATESLSAHVGQRIRWARGMAQIFRVDNPLFKKGLEIGQRLCYANAMLHFFYGFPRVVFLSAPLAYLLFDAKVIAAQGLMIISFAIPHLVMAIMTNSRLQGKYRHSFWAEVYETVLAVFIIIPTTLAMINPKLGKFNVTAKGGIVDRDYFDGDIARPYFYFYLANFIGLVIGSLRMLLPGAPIDTIGINMGWTAYNLLILGAAICVASEKRQVRHAVRVRCQVPVALRLPGSESVELTETLDLSYGGSAVPGLEHLQLEVGASVEVALIPDHRLAWTPATVRRAGRNVVALEFGALNPEQEAQLVYALYGRADAWLRWRDAQTYDRPLVALKGVANFGRLGTMRFFRWMGTSIRDALLRRGGASTTAATLAGLAAALALGAGIGEARAQTATDDVRAPAVASADAGARLIRLEALGANAPLRLRTSFGQYSLPLSLRTDQVVDSAELTLEVSHSPALRADKSHLNVLLNDELVDTWRLTPEDAAGAQHTLDINPNLFLPYNQLRFELIASYAIDECEDPAHPTLWAQISNQSALRLKLAPLPIQPDLSDLPAPFFEAADTRRLQLPVIMGPAPEDGVINAAAIIASWFGALADYRGAEFPVRFSELPPQHAVVLRTRREDVPLLEALPIPETPEIRVIAHPGAPAARLLVISARDAAGALQAARSLVFGSDSLRGDHADIGEFTLPPPRNRNDSPRWANPDAPIDLGAYADKNLNARGLAPGPINVDFRLPPDLFMISGSGPTLDFTFRAGGSIAERSALSVLINNHFVGDEQLKRDSAHSLEQRERMVLPKAHIGHRNRLSWQFHFVRSTEKLCEAFNPDLLQGSVDRDATLTFPRHAYYAEMPELSLMAEGGFPYTRYADGAQTAFVLPVNAAAQDIAALLTVAGHLGHQGSVPLIRSVVFRDGQVPETLDRDLVIVGRSDRLGLLDRLNGHLPIQFEDSRVTLRRDSVLSRWIAEARGRDLDGARAHAGEVIHDAAGTLGAVIGAASPWAAERSLIIFTAAPGGNVFDVSRALLDPGQSQYFGGDLTLVHGDTVSGYSLGPTYAVGHLPWDYALRKWVSENPLLMLPLLILAVLLFGAALRTLLRRRAARRHAGTA
ncbi:UDP-forming cellulose synthase catalytic subunit [Flagellatimonas centrodinii]|uniref:UDP-forming cellulose synthase catalytic subunit n=1 Tax=Flagellatimonas centrodinii TaxID=2806210 RepID=UPI001FFC234A|nr:UDP-forming cellulose synthase catalytic subunit [Flagellatimonas centrodinii]ULQ45367.1 UDP-forming cellulose synthase catalytic subunit [Flagellatimonas centrodinii]